MQRRKTKLMLTRKLFGLLFAAAAVGAAAAIAMYDAARFDKEGYDRNGYDRDGYDRQGYDAKGYDRKGFDNEGYDCIGYNAEGYDRNGKDSERGNIACDLARAVGDDAAVLHTVIFHRQNVNYAVAHTRATRYTFFPVDVYHFDSIPR